MRQLVIDYPLRKGGMQISRNTGTGVKRSPLYKNRQPSTPSTSLLNVKSGKDSGDKISRPTQLFHHVAIARVPCSITREPMAPAPASAHKYILRLFCCTVHLWNRRKRRRYSDTVGSSWTLILCCRFHLKGEQLTSYVVRFLPQEQQKRSCFGVWECISLVSYLGLYIIYELFLQEHWFPQDHSSPASISYIMIQDCRYPIHWPIEHRTTVLQMLASTPFRLFVHPAVRWVVQTGRV